MKSIVSPLVIVILLGAAAVAQSNSSPYNNGSSNSSAQMITNGPVAETVADSNAVIGWSSKQPAHGTSVRYGTARDRMTQTAPATENSDAKNHHARLDNLSPDTAYYFQVMENGEALGGIGTFRTVAQGEKPVQSKAVISQK
jgi:phosphodiesterase/alkaline phosphatase D-like protein